MTAVPDKPKAQPRSRRRKAGEPARWLEYVDVETIRPAKRNPKGHDIDGVTDMVTHFGYTAPIELDERTGRIVAGHGRLEVLQGLKSKGEGPPEGIEADGDRWLVPVIRGWRSRSDSDAEAYIIGANQRTIAGGWDNAELAEMLGDLEAAQVLNLSGFTRGSIDELLAGLANESRKKARTEPDDLPPVPEHPITNPGELWQIGPHRILCGSARNADDVARLLDGERAGLIITAPPYNVGVDYFDHDDRAVPWPEYRAFLSEVLEALLPNLNDGRAVCWNLGTSPQTHHARQQVLLEDSGLTYLRTMVWQKVGVPVPLWHFTEADRRARQFTPNYTHEVVLIFSRGDYQGDGEPDADRALYAWPARRPLSPEERHELVVVFAKGKKLRKGRPVSAGDLLANDVFQVAQNTSTQDLPNVADAGRTGANSNLETRARKGRPAPYPVALPEAFAAVLADVGEIVLDPFLGSGSTIVAAWRIGRRGYGMEVSPAYVDVACRRLQEHTGLVPVLASTGEPHDFTAHG